MYISQIERIKSATKNWKKESQVYVESKKYGIYGFIDQIVKNGNKTKIIEIKKGKASRPFLNDIIQLTAYCYAYVEGNDISLDDVLGELYYKGSGKKFKVKITKKRLEKLEETILNMNNYASDPMKPEYNSKKCKDCSLINICMPENKDLNSRKITPRNIPESLHVLAQGAYISKNGESIKVTINGEPVLKTHYTNISSLMIYGNVQVSVQTIKFLASNKIPIVFSNTNGKFEAIALGNYPKNGFVRIKQLQKFLDSSKRLEYAKSIVKGKIMNQLFVYRDKLKGNPKELSNFLSQVDQCRSIDELLGIEGIASQQYFSRFSDILKGWEFRERNRRPPKDPVNSLLSFGYSILLNNVLVTIVSTGLDPFIGFLHTQEYGRPSLALDLMEEFRPLLVDRVILSLILSRQIKKNDFIKNIEGGVLIKDKAKKRLIDAINKRMNLQHYHPLFKRRLEYRRIIEAQVRLFEKLILDEIEEYKPFVIKK
jgi:CRISPR-associated protein Cas1